METAMAVLGRLLVGSQQRIDLADFLSVDSYASSDFRYLIKSWTGNNPLVLTGLEVIDAPLSIGTNSIAIKIADAVLYNPAAQAGSFYFGPVEGDALAQPLIPVLKPNATNYVYTTLTTVGQASDSRAFWDTDLNGGAGGEFNQTVNTESVLTISVNVSVSTFPDSTVPVCKVVTNATGEIISIQDCRNMMFRLGTGGVNPDANNKYFFRNNPSSTYARNEPPSTVNNSTGANPFFGGDKNIQTLKEWMDAVMTKLLELSGTTYWYESSANLSVMSIFDDLGASNIKSKGQWTHDITTPGKVTWSEDIIYRKLNDPRELIIRANAGTGVTLADDQVLFIEILRNQLANSINEPVDWENQPYVTGIAGSFANLSIGDWVKRQIDDDGKYARVTGFKNISNADTTALLAVKITLDRTYNILVPETSEITYSKGEYTNVDIQNKDRTDPSLFTMGSNFYWLANRSDTIENIASIVPTTFLNNVDIIESNGATAKLSFATPHGLIDGDRITIADGGLYNGTYQIDVESTTVVSFDSTITSNATGVTASYAIITTAVREMVSGFTLESANHGFESNQIVQIANTITYNGAYAVSNRSNTTFQVAIPYNIATETAGTATCARVNLRTEFGSARVIQGEIIDINEPDTNNILAFIGMNTLAQRHPIYATPLSFNAVHGYHNFNCADNDDVTVRLSKLTGMMADRVQDRGMKIQGRGTFRNFTSGLVQRVSCSGDNLLIEKPGSPQQTVTIPLFFDLGINQALTATIDRNGSSAITPIVESLGSPFLLNENKIILFSRYNDNNVYAWNSQKILNSSSWTSNDNETSQNKNIVISDVAGVRYDVNALSLTYCQFMYNGGNQVTIYIPGSPSTNYIDTAAINLLSGSLRTILNNQSLWIRINRTGNKVFNVITNSVTYQDSDIAGALYITNSALVPTDEDVFVVYTATANSLLKLHHTDPVGNIYEEVEVLAIDVVSGGMISLPLDSRNYNETQYYIGNSGQLEVSLNGQIQTLNEDYSEPDGIGNPSNRIQILRDLVIDDKLKFRIASQGGVYFSPIAGSVGTMQNTYDNGNAIITTSGRPIIIDGPVGEKLLTINGDIDVTGVIDPKGMEFTPQSSSPLKTDAAGIWVNASNELIYQKDSSASVNINEALIAMTSSSAIQKDLFKNDSNVTIAALSAVSIGLTGNLITTNVSDEVSALSTVGLTINTMLNNATDNVILSGRLVGVTTPFSYRDVLYVSKDGSLTNNKPTIGSNSFISGDFIVKVGVVCSNSSNPLVQDIVINIQVVGQL
jgi:hypothetical protein